MSIFANVYTGATANDGTGDSLRVAFQKIDQNFANIVLATGTSPVMSVAGRQGNIQLYVNDVHGAASNIFVRTQTAAANAYTDTTVTTAVNSLHTLINVANIAAQNYTNTIFSDASYINTNLTTLYANLGRIYANLGNLTAEQDRVGDSGSGLIGTLGYNLNLNSNDIANLKSNVSGLQSTAITLANTIDAANARASAITTAANVLALSEVNALGTAVNTAINTANVGMKSYVDTATSVLTDTTVSQASTLATLTANAANQATTLLNLQSNAAVQEAEITALRANLTVTGAALVTANAAVVNYVNDLNNQVQLQLNAANAAIVTANTGLKSYTDSKITVTVNAAIATLVNSAPSTLDTLGEIAANLAQEGNAINSLLGSLGNVSANVTAANSAIATLTTNWQANAGSLASSIASTNSAIVTANSAVVSYVNTQVAALQANGATQETEISGLRANITAANGAIITANTGMKSYVDAGNTTVFSIINAINSNVAIQTLALNDFAANVQANVQNLANAVTAANSAITTSNSAVVNYVNNLTSAINANVHAANTNIATNSATIATINSTLAGLTANVTTGYINTTGNITGGNLKTAGYVTTGAGVIFADGTRLTTANMSAVTGNINFSGYTMSTTGDTGGNFGITLNPANGGEVHINTNTGINTVNPAYWLDIGYPNGPVNTATLGLNFSNNSGSYANTTVFTYDWWDGVSNGQTNNSSTKHATLGLYRGDGVPGTTVTKAFITFDTASAGAVAPIQVNANSSVTMGNTVINNGITTPTLTLSSAIQFANLTTTQITAIASPARGMTVYNYTTGNVQVYNGTKWANVVLS